MANTGIVQKSNSANKSWVEICDDELSSNSSADENVDEDCSKVKKNLEENHDVKVNDCTVQVKEEIISHSCDKTTPAKVSTNVKAEIDIETKNDKSPWNFSYASILKNSASKNNINISPRTPTKQSIEKLEVVGSVEDNTTIKSVKREIQREFLQEDLSLSSHLDVFHMQSPLKLEPADEVMASPVKVGRPVKKRLGVPKLSMTEDAVMCDEVLMPSPKKVTRMSRRKREPDESPLTKKRSKQNSSGAHNTPRCVVPVEPPTIELETDEQILLRRQKQIDYGKNTIGYERYGQLVPKEKRHKKHPQTPPKHIKYSRRAWDGLIRQWRQQLHFWDPPSEGGGNIDDLDISSMSEASSDTTSQTSSLPPTPRDVRKSRRLSKMAHSSASESSSIADDSGISPLKDK